MQLHRAQAARHLAQIAVGSRLPSGQQRRRSISLIRKCIQFVQIGHGCLEMTNLTPPLRVTAPRFSSRRQRPRAGGAAQAPADRRF